ncbi:hypothetical protein [Larsenimonas suaedae]|uniref:Lipoprotein n=1 Tax=Larsenimonas suaedae TaxID=1851019 RepID=A0ABU1GSN6_9GAMM|nr:hypothetical protein [Larsenimonas suaedae]MCM2972165.1 hypothetical protein [Larsenimonas suaedae]MDR5895039.1 hypothetical protein [Larsenimonas suaedae]
MMKSISRWARYPLILLALALTGCASGLNAQQQQEYAMYKERGQVQVVKDPDSSAILGMLPGGGSWYTGNYGVAALNTALWPLSMLWDPANGYNAATSANYLATRSYLQEQQRKEEARLKTRRATGKLSEKDYAKALKELKAKYTITPMNQILTQPDTHQELASNTHR